MSTYFARIDENNIVQEVIVADQAFVNTKSGTWIQTDISGISPKNYASIGSIWDSGRNAFITQKPFNSWILNNTTCMWEAPVACPNDGNAYMWNEYQLNWILA